jgi:uncharacterized protein YjbI with pentapeptide repeats
VKKKAANTRRTERSVRVSFLFVALLVFSSAAAAAETANLRFCFGCNFAGTQFASTDFSDVVYVGSNFAGAPLHGASFRGAKLVAANFQGADLSASDFDDSECTACNFEGAKLDGASFDSARLVAANFVGFSGKVTDETLRGLLSECYACSFRGASFRGRDLSGLSMIGVDLSGADLRDAKLNGAVLCWYAIDGNVRKTQCAKMKGAQAAGASFAGVLVCVDPVEAQSCTAVTADELRRDSGSVLEGATLP